MAWMKRLAETYDLYQDLAGIVKDGQPVLLPVSHSTINAQIEVTLKEHDSVRLDLVTFDYQCPN